MVSIQVTFILNSRDLVTLDALRLHLRIEPKPAMIEAESIAYNKPFVY